MRIILLVVAGLIAFIVVTGCRKDEAPDLLQPTSSPIPLPVLNYPWKKAPEKINALANRIAVPAGYQRTTVEAGSFAEWLRFLPLKEGRPPIHLYNGQLKSDQGAHVAVVDIDVGNRDLQQCADAIIRLRGEYLYSRGRNADIQFDFTNGTPASFPRWAAGYRPLIRGNNVSWVAAESADTSHASFREYMNTVFAYAGTLSLSKELTPVNVKEIRIGDVFIVGGSPGHAILVVDMAVNSKTGEKLFLLAQGFMPAQDIHILKNPAMPAISPWYTVNFGETLVTPNWTFTKNDLKRF